MAMSRLMQLLSLSPSPHSDSGSDQSQDTVVRDDDHSDAIDPGLLIVPIIPGEGGLKTSTTVTRIWNRPNGISSEYPHLGGKTYLDHAGTTVGHSSTSDPHVLASLTKQINHSSLQLRFWTFPPSTSSKTCTEILNWPRPCRPRLRRRWLESG